MAETGTLPKVNLKGKAGELKASLVEPTPKGRPKGSKNKEKKAKELVLIPDVEIDNAIVVTPQAAPAEILAQIPVLELKSEEVDLEEKNREFKKEKKEKKAVTVQEPEVVYLPQTIMVEAPVDESYAFYAGFIVASLAFYTFRSISRLL